MTISEILILFIITAFFSCKNADRKSKSGIAIIDTLQAKPEVEKQIPGSDTIKRFIVDDYPVTDSMFGRDTDGREIKSGELRSLDKVWFSNDKLNQMLVFELYTDNHRTLTYHFTNTNIPTELIKSMELNVTEGDTASNEQKIKDFKGFLSKTKKISGSYFITNKGLKLGESITQAIKIYGKPDNTEMKNGIEEYYWEFEGDIMYNGKTDVKDKPLAKDSYGHQIRMFFKSKRLLGLIFHNEIP